MICRYGAPDQLLSDRGQNFLAKLVTEVCKIFDITRLHTSSYHPQTNAQCERFNATIAQSIRAYIDDKYTSWARALPGIAAALRTVPCTQTTLFSPFFILFKQECRLPIDTALIKQDLSISAKPCMEEIIKGAELTKRIVQDNLEKTRIKNKDTFSEKTKPIKFALGQKVWLTHSHKTPGISPKLQSRFIGPYYISKILLWDTYIIRNVATNKQIKSPINAARLKAFQCPSLRPTNRLEQDEIDVEEGLIPEEPVKETTERDGLNNAHNDITSSKSTEECQKAEEAQAQLVEGQQENDELFIVQRLVCSKIIKKVRHYKVKWQGYRQCTWEPEHNLPDHLIQEFHINKTVSGKKRKKKVNGIGEG